MVIVPNVAPDTPPVRNTPVFLYMQDRFSKPNPFSHDIVVGIDSHIDAKLAGLDAHTSQMYEWLPWTAGSRSEEHTSELQSRGQLVCRLLLEKKKLEWL